MLKILVWCTDEPMEYRLTNLLTKEFGVLAGIVIEKRESRANRAKGLNLGKLLLAVINKLFFYRLIDMGWIKTQSNFRRQFKEFPLDVPTKRVNDINSEATQKFCQELDYDLIVVSGTGLIKKHMFKYQGSKGIINLHTGLSPYIKGGPNCTNWCISTKNYHLIGNTVMWLDEGIDSGNIICTEFAKFNTNQSLTQLLQSGIEQGQDLYIRAIRLFDSKIDKLPSIKQSDITKGKTYYSKQWGFLARLSLVTNFYLGDFSSHSTPNRLAEKRKKIITIDLTDA